MNIVIKLLIYFTDLYNIFSYIFIQFYEAKLNVEKSGINYKSGIDRTAPQRIPF